MLLTDFIKNNPDWRTLITGEPYCIDIKENDAYIIFKYNQIESDFNNPLVKECRGIIFRKSDWKCVCRKFDKFMNFGEGPADKIDWNTARVQEKIDGNLIALWHDDGWHISTNGMIDAFETTCPTGERFGDLFTEAFERDYGSLRTFMGSLDTKKTYVFELCHPLTRVVIRYEYPMVYHTGTRDIETMQELNIDIGVRKPKEFKFNSLEDVIAMAQTLPYSQEGYVVVDANWRRVKVKAPSYVAVHHLKNNGVITYKRLIELVIKNEQCEFTNYFPEFQPYIDKTVAAWETYVSKIKADMGSIKDKVFPTRKDYALEVKTMTCSPFMFKAVDKGWGEKDIVPFLSELPRDRLVEWIGLKQEEKVI